MIPSKLFYFLFIVVIITGIVSVQLLGRSNAQNLSPAEGRPDLVVIDIPDVQGKEDMPNVPFLHGPHSQAVKGDCTVCHLKDMNGTMVFSFKRRKAVDAETAMELYHDNCVACHIEKMDAAEKFSFKSGPLAGECRNCHSTWRGRRYQPDRYPVAFDRSLHFRHEKSDQVKPAAGFQDKSVKTNCGACHHTYDGEAENIFYEKGKESACIYCHKEHKTETGRSIRQASHDACVACHQKLTEKQIVAGPVTCINCHGKDAFKDILVIENVPRVERNQPDALFVTGWGGMDLTLEELKKEKERFMQPVPFNHQSHEKMTTSCTDCHHQSLAACSQCHTPEGDEKGGYIRLDQAMHSADSRRSCLGCHDSAKNKASCAGCHFSMAAKPFADRSCEKCHYGGIGAGRLNPLLSDADEKNLAQSALDALSAKFKPVAPSKIPETVEIGVIAKTYEPSKFPHRKIVAALTDKIAGNDMAAVFHGDGRTLCLGCHHHSPLSETPPPCASCHGQSTIVADGRPGLKGAYHRQCITCHQKMNIETVSATDCTVCHEQKQ